VVSWDFLEMFFCLLILTLEFSLFSFTGQSLSGCLASPLFLFLLLFSSVLLFSLLLVYSFLAESGYVLLFILCSYSNLILFPLFTLYLCLIPTSPPSPSALSHTPARIPPRTVRSANLSICPKPLGILLREKGQESETEILISWKHIKN